MWDHIQNHGTTSPAPLYLSALDCQSNALPSPSATKKGSRVPWTDGLGYAWKGLGRRDSRGTVALDRKKAEDDQDAILSIYDVSDDRSSDLKTAVNSNKTKSNEVAKTSSTQVN